MNLNFLAVEDIIINALKEDMGFGDITTNSIFSDKKTSTGNLVAKEKGIVSGIFLAEKTWRSIDNGIFFETYLDDGDIVNPGDEIASIEGKVNTLLTGERVALNFLQRLSGIATLTSKYVAEIKHTKAKIVDTRKTTPGLRMLEKYAVTTGGGRNHRLSLDNAVLIKDNHIAGCGTISEAVRKVKENSPIVTLIEVETQNIHQVEESIESGADIIMLDNMDIKMMREAVKIISGRALTEASGGVNLNRVKEIAETGVDFISIGALTHSPSALDISFNLT